MRNRKSGAAHTQNGLLRRFLALKLTVGRVAIPAWVLAVVLIAGGVAAGQAVGPVLNGSLVGSAGLLAEQAVVTTEAVWRDYPPTQMYSISPRDDKLRVVDSADVVKTSSSVTITLSGKVVEGGNGLAIHPITQTLYALLKLQGQAGRELVTLDTDTGVATSIGDTGDRFAGLAFDGSGTLYAVTGDGAGVPETLYTLNLTTAVPTSVLTLGNGNDGETIAFNPDDSLIYHASGEGIPNVNEVFETIDPSSLTVTKITILGQDYAEATALTYEGGGNFFLADLGRRLFRINTDGVVEYVGIIDHDTKGLAPFGLAHVDDSLAVINDEGTSFTAGAETHIGDSLMLILTLDNLSDADANATLELDVPDEIDVGIQTVGSVEAGQLSADMWVLKVPSTLTEGKLKIIMKPTEDHKPGFHTIKGRIEQIEG